MDGWVCEEGLRYRAINPSAVRIGTAVCPHHGQASESPQSLLQLCAPVMRMLGDTDRRLRFYLCEPAYYASRVYEGASLGTYQPYALCPTRTTPAQEEGRQTICDRCEILF